MLFKKGSGDSSQFDSQTSRIHFAASPQIERHTRSYPSTMERSQDPSSSKQGFWKERWKKIREDSKIFSSGRTSLLMSRIANHRPALAFVILCLIHFLIHLILQSILLATDSAKQSAVDNFADLPTGTFVSFENRRWLKGCNETMDVRAGFDGKLRGCPVLFDAAARTITTAGGTLMTTGDTGVAAQIGMASTRHGVCDTLLLWAYQTFQNEVRTDASFIAMEFWLLFVSIAAVATESLPLLISSTIIRFLSTVWSCWAMVESNKNKWSFRTLITSQLSPCAIFTRRIPGFLQGMDRMTDLEPWFARTMTVSIVIGVANILFLVATSVAAYLIYRIYRDQHIDHVGACAEVAKNYKWLAFLSACLHLSAFVVFISMSLWIDRLFSIGGYHLVSEPLQFYRAWSILMIFIAIGWLISGHIGYRRELRKTAVAFLALGTMLIASYLTKFTSVTFRTFFTTWSFFSTMFFASFALILMTIIVGIICRRNFGKGLKHFLHVRRVLAESHFPADGFTDTSRPASHVHSEKKSKSGYSNFDITGSNDSDFTMKSFIQAPEPPMPTLRAEPVATQGRMAISKPYPSRLGRSGSISANEAQGDDDYKTQSILYDGRDSMFEKPRVVPVPLQTEPQSQYRIEQGNKKEGRKFVDQWMGQDSPV